MLLYFGGVLFGNSKSRDRLELIGPIVIIENKTYTIDFSSVILGYLYYYLDQASKQEVKYIGGLFQLIEYNCYEYCQIGHHILIDNRLDDFWPRMLAWQTTRQKFTGNKTKHHLVLIRQQLDFCTINNMQWEPFRNMKDALKREVIIARNISRKRVLLQCPFGGYEWYLGDRCWAQLKHRAVPYDPPEKLLNTVVPDFPTSDVVSSLRAVENLRRAEDRLFQLNEYLDGEGIEVGWEDEAGTSQAGTSRGRGSRGRGSRGRTSEGGAAPPQ
ncbi:hypothetical protein GIB67_018010 [Kingdonia uniflora]|uniref:Aminotransferase-like plant mobile domain-containing protein n=1 Tax=Kingdonia uniflora TaxID=39325 RepID=A0A7J7NWD1_9MAGN|nr:hypothetical protein GIB67_018010 [Kingdonia uniflora]